MRTVGLTRHRSSWLAAPFDCTGAARRTATRVPLRVPASRQSLRPRKPAAHAAHAGWPSRSAGQLDQRDDHAARAAASEHAAGDHRRSGARRREQDRRRRSKRARRRAIRIAARRRSAASCARARTPSRPISSGCGRPAPARSAATTRSGSIRAIACCASTASRAARSSSIRRTAASPATPTRRARAWRRRRRSARRRAASSIIPSCGRSPSAASRRSAATPDRRCCRTTSTTTATRIVQSKDTVVILTEMVHDARVVRIGGTHPPSSVRKWFGDSIGRWEGDTLVIETTNFHPNHGFRGSWENLKITERLSRKDAQTHQLPLHRRGSDDVHGAVHRRAGVQRDGAGRDGLRVRVPRSQLRPRRRDEGARAQEARSGEEEDAAAVDVTARCDRLSRSARPRS